MSLLKANDKVLLEDLLEMDSGYVLDFTNSTFSSFVFDSIGIRIYNDSDYPEHPSKAKKLRHIWSKENDYIVSTLMIDLLEYCYNYYLKENKLTDYYSKLLSDYKTKFNNIKAQCYLTTLPNSNDDTLVTLRADINDALTHNKPDLVLDRLHTFSKKYIQTLCESHSISITDNKNNNLPLHSLLGNLIKYYKTNDLIESDFSIQALKSCISIYEKFNHVRNNQSYAHTNNILNKTEAEFAIRIMSDTLTFLDHIENKL